MAVILLSSVIASSFINFKLSRDAIRAELMNSSLPLTRDNIYSELHGKLMNPIVVASSMANDTFLHEWAMGGETNATRVVLYLDQIKQRYRLFSTFFVSSRTGRYYYYDGILKTLSTKDDHDQWYYNFINSGGEYVLDVDSNQASDNTLTIFINFRVQDASGKLLGVTGVGLQMGMFSKLLKETEQKFGRKVFFVDNTGLVQAHPDPKAIQALNLNDIPGTRELAPSILNSKKEPASFQYDTGSGHHLLTCRYIPEFKWFLVVDQDETEALAAIRESFMRTIAIGLLSAIVVIIITLATVNKYQKKLEGMALTDELTGAANRRALEKQFKLACYKTGRGAGPFSIVLIDVDGLKRVNDKHGHLAGDNLIKSVAHLAQENTRPTDLMARWGGDEFIILADCGIDEAEIMAERIRLAVSETDMAAQDAKPDDQRRDRYRKHRHLPIRSRRRHGQRDPPRGQGALQEQDRWKKQGCSK